MVERSSAGPHGGGCLLAKPVASGPAVGSNAISCESALAQRRFAELVVLAPRAIAVRVTLFAGWRLDGRVHPRPLGAVEMLNLGRFRRTAVTLSLIACAVAAANAKGTGQESKSDGPSACALLSPSSASEPSRATTSVTVGEAYRCLLGHYGGVSALRPDLLLRSAMGGVIGYLRGRGEDSVAAALPPLSSDPGAAWRSFQHAFDDVVGSVPGGSSQISGLADAAIEAMTASLHDDHTDFTPARRSPLGASQPDLGIYVRTAATRPQAMVIDDVDPAGPSARAGLRRGDLVEEVEGRPVPLPPASDLGSAALDQMARLWTPAQLGWIPARSSAVTLLVRRPTARRPFRVKVVPATSMYNISARALPGGVAYVRIHGFLTPSTGNDAVAAVRRVEPSRGVIVDLRGNTGGNPQALASLIGAFVHHRVVAINVDRAGRRQLLLSDDSVRLLDQPLVLLVDGGSLSAAETAAADVKDLRLGSVIGERTAGIVAGAGLPFVLDDGSVLAIDTAAALGPDGEIIDGIGVPVDRQAPLPTPLQLARGQDPAITAALHELAATLR
jgi:carboxyl-terminal processing protease